LFEVLKAGHLVETFASLENQCHATRFYEVRGFVDVHGARGVSGPREILNLPNPEPSAGEKITPFREIRLDEQAA